MANKQQDRNNPVRNQGSGPQQDKDQTRNQGQQQGGQKGKQQGLQQDRNDSDGRGFAGMDEDRQRQIASMGGRAAHQSGNAHEFDSQEGRDAGRKGGQASAQNRANDIRGSSGTRTDNQGGSGGRNDNDRGSNR